MNEGETNFKLPTVGEIISSKRQKYQTMQLLGKGGFGAVFEVKKTEDGRPLAMKIETVDVKKPVLSMDCKVLRGAFLIRSPHFCTILDRGKTKNRFRFLVMKLVGRNLWDLRINQKSMKFSLGTSLKSAEQSLMAIQDLHAIGFLHRDIKPGNFAIGREEDNENHIIFMLDFGLCRKFVDEESKDLKMPRASVPFRGTTRYASLAALRQMEQSRKDDIEAWFYMVVEWTSGRLPWRKFKKTEKSEILKLKQDVRSGDDLEEFLQNCPKKQFTAILQYIDGLGYQSIPDYDYIHYCLSHAEKTNKIDFFGPLDWDPEKPYGGPRKDRRILEATKDTGKIDNFEDKVNPENQKF